MAIEVKTKGELGKLLAKVSTKKPAQADRAALDAYLAAHGVADLAAIGDLSARVEDSIINQAFGQDYGFCRAVGQKLDALSQGLGYDKASPLEQMLISHILVCWLRLHDCELRFESVRADRPTIDQMQHWEKRLSMAQRRYLRAIESLAKVRRLLYRPDPPRNNVAFNFLAKQVLNSGR